jgi:diamine N-acetyltransferase
MPRVALAAAGSQHITVIRQLAHVIWEQHYPDIIGRQQVDYMLNLMYSEAALAAQMQEGQRFYLVMVNDSPEGFVSYSIKDGGGFIHKFYINQQLSGKGIGSQAFDLLLEAEKPATIRLTVNRQNYKSVNFYFKKGFVIEKVADFDIGEGYVMNDFVMRWDQQATEKT